MNQQFAKLLDQGRILSVPESLLPGAPACEVWVNAPTREVFFRPLRKGCHFGMRAYASNANAKKRLFSFRSVLRVLGAKASLSLEGEYPLTSSPLGFWRLRIRGGTKAVNVAQAA